jgi:23S rRNA (uracil1939-C5)-methyltransferase
VILSKPFVRIRKLEGISYQENWVSRNMQQGDLIEIEITDLNHTGEGVGKYQGQVVFVADTVIGDRIQTRITYIKKSHAIGRLQAILQASPHRIRPRCIVADKCGGCQWQHIEDQFQRRVKQQQVYQALERIGGFSEPLVSYPLTGNSPLAYRNKATYPLGFSATGNVQAGYYRRGSHNLINLNQCPIQDTALNPFLAEIKNDIQQRGWSIYDEKSHQGQLRHLSLRIGRNTGEILLTLITTDWDLKGLETQAADWLAKYTNLVGVTLNYNPDRGNAIFGSQTKTIAGRDYITEKFAGLTYQLASDTFFQINTEAAEALLAVIIEKLALKGDEILIDAYCGIGTFTLPLAKQVKEVIGLESYRFSLERAEINAQLNHITNTTFILGAVEATLPQVTVKPDVILLDPPRKGCDRSVLDSLLKLQSQRIVYISCQSATLARDLQYLCQTGDYELLEVQTADFFPQTPHVECAAFLRQKRPNMLG